MIGWVDASGELVRVSAPGEPVPECNGMDHVDVPDGFLTGALEWDQSTRSFITPDDVARTKGLLSAGASRIAEDVRNRFLTPGSGQAITYTRKEAEARAWKPGADPAEFPFLTAEASATNMTLAALAALVIAQADAWIAVGSAIEAHRRGLLVAIDAATTRAQLDAIDITAGWPGTQPQAQTEAP